MGRRADDPAVQKAKGFPGKRNSKTERAIAEAERLAKLLADAPAGPDGVPMVPAMLRNPLLAAAAQVWTDHSAELQKYSLLEKLDRFIFGLFCIYAADFVIASEDILLKGYSVKVRTVSGDLMPRDNPSVGRRDTAAKMLLEMAKEYAMTPLSRLKLFKDQAGMPAGGLWPQGHHPQQPTAAEADKPLAPVEEDVIGSLDRFDSPPPGSRPN